MSVRKKRGRRASGGLGWRKSQNREKEEKRRERKRWVGEEWS